MTIGDDILIVSVSPEHTIQRGTPAPFHLDVSELSRQYVTSCVQRCPACSHCSLYLLA